MSLLSGQPPAAEAPTQSSGATILPVLVSQGIVSSAQAGAIPAGDDNASVELYVKLNRLATDEQILQAYAILYGIPFVHLKNRRLKPEIVNLIPEITARRYDVVAFEKQGKVLQVAISSPRRFKNQEKHGILHKLQAELKVKIAPALAPVEEIRASFAYYEHTPQELADQAAVTSGPIFPTVSLVNQMVPIEIAKKIPYEVANRYRFVAFAQADPGHIFIATPDPTSKAIQQVLAYLQQKNKISVTVYQTDEPSLQYVLRLYQPNKADVNLTGAQPGAVANTGTELPGEEEAKQALANPQVAANARKLPTVADPKAAAAAAQDAKTLEITADQLISGANESSLPLSKLSAAPPPGSIAALSANGGKNSKSDAEQSASEFDNVAVKSVDDLALIVRSGNIPKMVAGIVSLAIAMRASDIHVEAEKEKIRLRYRIDGELEDILFMPHLLHAPLISRIKILSQMKIDETRVPQDGRFEVKFREREIDLRVSNLPTVYGEKVVIRILDKTSGLLSLEQMGIDGINLKRIIDNIEKPYGIVLSTGPTGSGKSTTLYAALHRISRTNVNVVTLEDPVEYEMEGINQVQIRSKIGFTFAEGLRSILRQDPNVIMVGEIRDKETAEMATQAALTGHLVLSTLHTNDAAGSLPRLIDMGIEPFLITSSINAVMGQRLIRRVCKNCKTEEKLPQGTIDELAKDLVGSNVEKEFQDPKTWKFYRGQGCPQCRNGYKGRIGIFEVMSMSDELESLAVKNSPATVIAAQALKEGMITMKQDGLVKALKGLTTVEEVLKATIE